MSDASALAESKTAEAINAASNAAEAIENARAAQMVSAFEAALEKVFNIEDKGGQRRFVDVTRVPLICQAIVSMEARMGAIEDNLRWGVRIVIGAVILAVLALIIK